jgi:hypothetical protein
VTKVEKSLIRGLKEYLRIVGSLGLTPPLVVMPTLLGVRGCPACRIRESTAAARSTGKASSPMPTAATSSTETSLRWPR